MTSVIIPTGGTTGHSHEHSAAVEEAAVWLAEQKEPPRLVVPLLQSQFGLTALEATEAIAMAQQFRIVRKAFG